MSSPRAPANHRPTRPQRPRPLFVFVLEGDDPKGFRRCLLAFASAADETRAGKLADDRLLALGWSDLELQAARTLDPALQADADPITLQAMTRAVAEGFAMIVY